jgi:hypothetical protein
MMSASEVPGGDERLKCVSDQNQNVGPIFDVIYGCARRLLPVKKGTV